MTLHTTVSHAITFTVEAFWDEEGGMGHDQFGAEVQQLPEAIHLLSLARAQSPKTNWVLVGKVVTTVK